jgi:hypothetical protein
LNRRPADNDGYSIVGRVIEANGVDLADAALRKAIGEQALSLLRSFRKRGTVKQIGLGVA